MIEEQEDGDDTDDSGLDESPSCPYCGEGAGCPHFLGTRDDHFNEGLDANPDGPLEQLLDAFRELQECLELLRDTEPGRSRTRGLREPRVKALQTRLAKEDLSRGFAPYLRSLLRAAGMELSEASYSDDSGLPGFSSTIACFWCPDAEQAVRAIRPFVVKDIQHVATLLERDA